MSGIGGVGDILTVLVKQHFNRGRYLISNIEI
jgi:hypothetical protein